MNAIHLNISPGLHEGLRFRMLSLCLLFLIGNPAAISQKPYFNRVLPPAGKTFMHITGMVQDKQGYMWLASKNGLFRYDGYQMTHYKNNPLDPNSLATSELEAIALDSSGNIWIGTFNAGLEKFDPKTNTFTHYRNNPKDPSSISGDTISAVLCDRDGNIWVASPRLNKLDPKTNKFTQYRHNPFDPTSISHDIVRAIYEDRQGVLWIGTGSVYGLDQSQPELGGLNRMDKRSGKFIHYKHDPNDPFSIENNKVRAIYEDSKGNFWIGTAGDGLQTLDRSTGKFQHYHYDPAHPEKLSRPPLKKNNIYDHITFIHEDVTGALWIGTSESGLNYLNPKNGKVTHFENEKDTAGSYHDQTAWWAYTTSDGVLWISSLHGSLYRVYPRQIEIPFYSVSGNGISAVYEDGDGQLWFGTRTGGLIQYDASGKMVKKHLHDSSDPNSISSNEIACIYSDSEGNLWVGTFDGGLNRYNKTTRTFTRFKNDPGDNTSISNNVPIAIYDDPGNDLWVGTLYGLNRMNRKSGTFRRYIFNPNDDVEGGTNVVTSVFKDRNSKWWAGCWMKGGIKQFDPATGKFRTYLKGASVLNILEDRSGVLWICANEGVYRFDAKKDTFNRYEDPLFLTEVLEVRDMVEDNESNLWVATTNGIIRINAQRNETTLFGKSYGVNGSEFYFLACYRDRKGKLYFGYQSGYYAFYPEELTEGMKGPHLSIFGFRISNKPIVPGPNSPLKEPLSEVKTIRLDYNQNIFSFEFVGIDYSNSEDNHHLFMLENYDAGWNLAGSERKATYFNVPPGKYVFRIKMVNSYGIWAERAIEIIISPPWWTTWWFRIGAVLAIAGIFYLIVRWRERLKFKRKIEQSEKEKQLSELKRRTGELEMQALRAQMNPHFVFNSLNAINRFILENDKTQASEYLTKFSRLVRMILQNSQSSLITLESEIESLRLYLELEALRFDHRFEYKISMPKDLDIEIIKVPPLIIQPFAENAIWHGLMQKEENGHLYIDISEEGERLVIKIKDDGIGRKKSATLTSKSATKHKSMGLEITADRIAMLQRQSSQQSSVIINDLENADGTAAGTEVIIKIPVIYDKSDIGR